MEFRRAYNSMKKVMKGKTNLEEFFVEKVDEIKK
jgi:hypothetical protein